MSYGSQLSHICKIVDLHFFYIYSHIYTGYMKKMSYQTRKRKREEKKTVGGTGVRTRIAESRVHRANHYTTELHTMCGCKGKLSFWSKLTMLP